MYDVTTFQGLIAALEDFWRQQGCIILQPFDMEVGAGTFHPDTFLRAIGPEPWRAAHVQASRRPADGRYGEHPNRGQHFFQYQVVLKPSPEDFQDLYLESLKAIGIDPAKHDIRFVEDDWESPTLGASGLGWQVWMDGIEITQFTFFQVTGGRLVDARRFDEFHQTQLHRFITIGIDGLSLNHRAGAGLQERHRYRLTVGPEDLGHANFLAKNAWTHVSLLSIHTGALI